MWARGHVANQPSLLRLQAMRVIAESYLDRAVPVLRTSPDEVEFAVESLDARCRQLEGELGTYRPVHFLSRGVQVGQQWPFGTPRTRGSRVSSGQRFNRGFDR